MRAYPLTAIKGGINRLRTVGAPRADSLYDLVNAYVTEQGTIDPREGTARAAALDTSTKGLCAFDGTLHVFGDASVTVPTGYTLHVLHNPADDDVNTGNESTLTKIHFAQPFMGALYVVAEWSDGNIWHYWLANSGTWAADTVYMANDVVVPTVDNGFLYKAIANNSAAAAAQTWEPNVARAVGDRVLPTVDNGYYYEVSTVEGDVPVSGAVEPSWIASEGAITIESAYSSQTTTTTQDQTGTPTVPQSTQDRYGSSGNAAADAAFQLSLTTGVAKWQPGTLYQPGALVTPRSATPAVPSAITNGNFESGDTAWTKGAGWTITNVDGGYDGNKPYQGAWFAHWTGSAGTGSTKSYIEMATKVPVVAGQLITVTCYECRNGDDGTSDALWLRWYDAGGTLVHESTSGFSTTNKHKDYRIFTTQDITPGGATQVAAAFSCANGNFTGEVAIDAFVWDYQNLSPVSADFTIYEATQTDPATSATQEPIWPGTGGSVVDGGVTWLGGVSSTVKWTAVPIRKSGSTEPTWGTTANSTVADNTITWQATSGYVTEAPQSAIVALAAKKIFAADKDIVKFCATVNPQDWTTDQDAGYLPVGLNTYGSNPTAVLNLYRGNLAAMNSAGMQAWQVDEDPQLMALTDALPVGSTYQRAAQPIKNDLVYLSSLGVRNIGIAQGSTNIQAGGIGKPIDPLVLTSIQGGDTPGSIFYPARGQYWLWFGTDVYVLTFNDIGPSWSRYTFSESITDATLLSEVLYLRTSTGNVWRVDAEVLLDDESTAAAGDVTMTIASPAVVTWTAHGRSNGDIVTFATTGALPTGLTAGTPYYIISAATDTFEVAATSGGTAINTSGTQSGSHSAVAGTPFTGVLWWPHLDCGPIGLQKMLEGFDLVATGEVTVQVGYDQRDFSVLTTGYTLAAGDTLPGTAIPLPVSGASFSLKLTFSANQAWRWYAANLYINDFGSAGIRG